METTHTEICRPLKASFAGAKAFRHHFSRATAQLTISIGQAVHEGERLAATLALINRSFASCKVMIDDSIQWYTLAINAPEQSSSLLLQNAIAAGDHYLNTTSALFQSSLTIPYEIVRWKDWHGLPSWQTAVALMHQDYEENTLLRSEIQKNITTFLDRYEKRGTDKTYDRSRAWRLCLHYLLEECAVMRTFWVELGCHYEVYPSGRNEAMRATYEHYIQPYHPHLLTSIALRFHRLGRE